MCNDLRTYSHCSLRCPDSFHRYIHQYLIKRGYHKSAAQYALDLAPSISRDLAVPADSPTGFLFEWWMVLCCVMESLTTNGDKIIYPSQQPRIPTFDTVPDDAIRQIFPMDLQPRPLPDRAASFLAVHQEELDGSNGSKRVTFSVPSATATQWSDSRRISPHTVKTMPEWRRSVGNEIEWKHQMYNQQDVDEMHSHTSHIHAFEPQSLRRDHQRSMSTASQPGALPASAASPWLPIEKPQAEAIFLSWDHDDRLHEENTPRHIEALPPPSSTANEVYVSPVSSPLAMSAMSTEWRSSSNAKGPPTIVESTELQNDAVLAAQRPSANSPMTQNRATVSTKTSTGKIPRPKRGRAGKKDQSSAASEQNKEPRGRHKKQPSTAKARLSIEVKKELDRSEETTQPLLMPTSASLSPSAKPFITPSSQMHQPADMAWAPQGYEPPAHPSKDSDAMVTLAQWPSSVSTSTADPSLQVDMIGIDDEISMEETLAHCVRSFFDHESQQSPTLPTEAYAGAMVPPQLPPGSHPGGNFPFAPSSSSITGSSNVQDGDSRDSSGMSRQQPLQPEFSFPGEFQPDGAAVNEGSSLMQQQQQSERQHFFQPPSRSSVARQPAMTMEEYKSALNFNLDYGRPVLDGSTLVRTSVSTAASSSNPHIPVPGTDLWPMAAMEDDRTTPKPQGVEQSDELEAAQQVQEAVIAQFMERFQGRID